MKQLDTYYKALLEYKKIAGSNVECDSFLHAFSDADAASEGIELLKTVCTVEEDWVAAIEGGLIHIQNAINENRQFILSKGEVLPIEKVKTVSVESVKHLATIAVSKASKTAQPTKPNSSPQEANIKSACLEKSIPLCT